MTKKDFNDEDGVWRTIGGRKIFIRKGQNLADAMIESGKFKGQKNKPGMRESYRKEKSKDLKEEDDLYDIDNNENTLKSLQDFGKKAKENEQLYPKSEKEEVDKELGKAYPYREQYKQEGQVDLENIKEWKQYRDANQKALNRTTIPYNAQRNLNEINVANKEIDKARNNLNQKADEILGNKSTSATLNKDKSTNDKINTITQEEYDKLPNDYKGNLKDLVNSAKYSGESEDELRKQYESLGYDVDNDKTMLKLTENGTTLVPVKVEKSTNVNKSLEQQYADDLHNGKTKGTFQQWKDKRDGKEPTTQAELNNLERIGERKSTNETMNNAIREKASKKKEVEQDLPKATEIKEQGTSNRKEVSENIQAHILEYYDSPDDFVEQMDVFDYLPNNWKRGEEIAKGGSYLVYNGDMSDFLDSLKINPKGKKFSDDKAFDMYTSLIGRESAKLYDRIKRNQFNQYKKDHPLTKMTFEDFKDMKK